CACCSAHRLHRRLQLFLPAVPEGRGARRRSGTSAREPAALERRSRTLDAGAPDLEQVFFVGPRVDSSGVVVIAVVAVSTVVVVSEVVTVKVCVDAGPPETL